MKLLELHLPSGDGYLAKLRQHGFDMSKVEGNKGYVLSTFDLETQKQTVKTFDTLANAKAAAPEQSDTTPWLVYDTDTSTVIAMPDQDRALDYYAWAKKKADN